MTQSSNTEFQNAVPLPIETTDFTPLGIVIISQRASSPSLDNHSLGIFTNGPQLDAGRRKLDASFGAQEQAPPQLPLQGLDAHADRG